MKPLALPCAGAALAILFLTMLAVPQILSAQDVSTQAVPLERLLNPDGTLMASPGFTGTVDPAGWRLARSADGRPRFTRTARPASDARVLFDTADVHWDNRFVGPYGVDGIVYAIAMIGTDIYFGGSFAGTDKIVASNVVKWSTSSSTWSALGDGVDATARAMAVIGTDLYVGGSFTHAGGAPARYIAKWNGSAWSTLGTSPNDGVSSSVYALAASGTNLFVGGTFTAAASGTPVNYTARWDGSSWFALGTGVNSTVYALAVMGADLYAGGSFTTAGGNPARRIARWTGSAWATLGTSPSDGLSSTVYALAPASPNLYVGGNFSTAGSAIPVHCVARWDGATWAALGNGFTTAPVRALLVNGASVYAGGSFTASGITTVNRAAVWDTTAKTWSALNQGLNSTVYALLQSGAEVFAAGEFTSYTNTSTPAPANHIAKWSGGAWQALGTANSNSIDGASIYAVAVFGSDVYIGGTFITAGSISSNNIVKYNLTSNTWAALGSGPNNGVDDEVYAIVPDGAGNLYVGGLFGNAGGNPANHIAKWNGSAWSTLGTSPNDGVDGTVFAIALSGTNVFVGGGFTAAGGAGASRVARWSGTAWSALGTGVNNDVNALAIIASDLYAGGSFWTAGGTAVNAIARWNGTTWSPVGTAPNDGVSGSVNALVPMGSNLYVGGKFTQVAGTTISANGIALWNGSSWSPLGNGVVGTVYAVARSEGSLFVTGDFLSSGIQTVNYVARWDTGSGGVWSPLGSGLSNIGYAVAVTGNDVYVGGEFTMAGSKASFKLARWNPTLVATGVGGQPNGPRGFALKQNFPNPFNPTTAISYQLAAGSFVTLTVYDILGRKVATLVNELQAAGAHITRLDASGLASGVYIYRLTAGPFVDQKKMLLLK